MTGNLIHVKLDYFEAIQSKKDILSSQMNLLKILNSIKKYHALRSNELKIKIKTNRKLKEINTNIKKLQTTLPKIKVPEILKKNKDTNKPLEEIKETHYDSSIESQLQDIQKKLQAIQ